MKIKTKQKVILKPKNKFGTKKENGKKKNQAW